MINIFDRPVEQPQLGDEGAFSSQRRLRFGPLRISKEGIFVNDGTTNAVVVDADGFHGYDSSDTETIRVSSAGIEGYGTTGNTFKFYDQQGGTQYGQTGYLQSINAMYLIGSNGADLYLRGNDDAYLVSEGTDSGDGILISANRKVLVRADDDDNGSDTNDGVLLRGADTGETNSSGVWIYDHDNSAYQEVVGDGSGTKTAVVRTQEGYRALYCMESPEVWFMDFCYGRKVRKNLLHFWERDWEVTPDPLFLEVTEPPYIVMPTGQKNLVQLWAKRRGHTKKRFEKKTKEEFEANSEFWATPSKVKKGVKHG